MSVPAPTQLPKTFEEYNEARKESFMKVKEFKDNGGRMVGYLCTYAPLEIIDAAGAAAVGLCGTSNDTVAAAETVLPANLCPLIKSTYGFALTDTCPFTYFSDFILGETTCDGKKKMYELLEDLKTVYVLRLPHDRTRSWAHDAWYEECIAFKEYLEDFYGVKITDEKLRAATEKRNELRRATVDLFNLQSMNPPAIGSVELMSTMAAGNFNFDIGDFTQSLRTLADQRKAQQEAGEGVVSKDAKRIVLTGCPANGLINKVGKVIEDNGGVIVSLDSCAGERTQAMEIDPDAPDIMRALSDKYFNINCSIMTPNDNRMDNTLEMAKKYQADGVIDVVLSYCHTFNIEANRMQKTMEDAGIPYMKLETDYSEGDSGQVDTRLAAFIETI